MTRSTIIRLIVLCLAAPGAALAAEKQKLSAKDALLKNGVEEIIFAVDLLVAAGSGGRGYAELPPQFRSYAVHDRGLSNPRRAGNHQQESMISPGRHGGSVENPGR